MARRSPFASKLAIPTAKDSSFKISDNGTFVRGDVVISKTGLQAFGTTISMDKLRIINEHIGNGACSTVKRALLNSNNQEVALKVVNIFDAEKRRQLMNELSALTNTVHPNLLTLFGAFYHDDLVHIVLEYMDFGSVAQILGGEGKTVRSIPEIYICSISAQVLKGLEYLQSTGRVHRDIKPSNMLLNMGGVAKLSDFGISRLLADDAVCTTFIGTVNYMSPERLDGSSYSYPSDIWSYGLSFLEAAMGKYPYKTGSNAFETTRCIVDDDAPKIVGDFSSDFAKFIDRCLQKEPAARATCKELLRHPFVLRADAEPIDLASWVKTLSRG